ncbi:MAG: hypothetical protein ACR2F6_10410 [Mycobacteriales bacterium]
MSETTARHPAGTDGVPPGATPDPLIALDGSAVDAAAWPSRRAEILRLFAEHVYGVPPAAGRATGEQIDRDPHALDGLATRLEFACRLRPGGLPVLMQVYLPNAAAGPVPAFLGLNFHGNHTVHPDPAIPIGGGIPRRTDGPFAPGAAAASWPLAGIVRRGYAVATCCANDIEPDVADGPRRVIGAARRGSEVGALGAWAWGLSRLLDVLLQHRQIASVDEGASIRAKHEGGAQRVRTPRQEIDGNRVAVIGHSRMGKAALWAAAQDERFALVVSNESGCGGAALSRGRSTRERASTERRRGRGAATDENASQQGRSTRERASTERQRGRSAATEENVSQHGRGGETVEAITRVFPHWFAPAFTAYAGREDTLPVDQHLLLAAVAPRPLYVASAEGDAWSDPLGEYLGALGAAPVYRMLAGDGLSDPQPPAVGEAVSAGAMGYHLRAGEHAITVEDWRHYLDFADRVLR